MLKILTFMIFISLQVHGDTQSCKKDLADVKKFYEIANERVFDEAIKYFNKSTRSAYLALESCEKNPLFDFNPLYNYITTNEFKVQEIENSEVYLNTK